MNRAKQRKLDAKARRQESRTARYGTSPIQVPPPNNAVATNPVSVRGPGRPPKVIQSLQDAIAIAPDKGEGSKNGNHV